MINLVSNNRNLIPHRNTQKISHYIRNGYISGPQLEFH